MSSRISEREKERQKEREKEKEKEKEKVTHTSVSFVFSVKLAIDKYCSFPGK
jgi:hypothetical protein